MAWIGFIKQQRDMAYIVRKRKCTQKFGVDTGQGLLEGMCVDVRITLTRIRYGD
jgi:hypothetical protein